MTDTQALIKQLRMSADLGSDLYKDWPMKLLNMAADALEAQRKTIDHQKSDIEFLQGRKGVRLRSPLPQPPEDK